MASQHTEARRSAGHGRSRVITCRRAVGGLAGTDLNGGGYRLLCTQEKAMLACMVVEEELKASPRRSQATTPRGPSQTTSRTTTPQVVSPHRAQNAVPKVQVTTP